ncbi:MAG: M13 family metallopeptidase, partial [Myxococcales bacterium]|nr:M13 family metallopeptidase [Myxococcales bacterium]
MSYPKQDLSAATIPAGRAVARRVRVPLAMALVAGCFVACGGGASNAPPPEQPAPVPPEPPGKPTVQKTLADVGLDAAAMDKSVDPCTDFYSFACGGWIKDTEIPSDKARWVRSFSVIHEENEKELRRILEEAEKATDAEPVKQRLGTYYAACMDESAIEGEGTKPLEPLLKQIQGVRDQKSLIAAVTKLHQHRIWALFDISAQQDFADATKMIGFMDQNGLGLPDRDYYILEPAPLPKHTSDPKKHPSEAKAAEPSKQEQEALAKKKKLLADYEAHVARMLELGGMRGYAAKAAAKDVLKIETALAEVSKTKVERRDPKKLYNKVDLAGVEQAVPRFDWKSYFTALGTPELKDISITSKEFFAGVNEILPRFKPAQWKSYLTWQVLHAMAPTLGKAFVDEDFKLQKLLTGQEEIEARWKRCVAATDDALGEALAQPFVAEHFGGESKSAAESYVHAVAAAFDKEVDTLDWMDATTRQRAKQKLKAMAYLIGYPSKWKQYDFKIGKQFAANVLAAEEWQLKDDLSQLGKPVDREKWEMSPPTVNAYYHPNKNHM